MIYLSEKILETDEKLAVDLVANAMIHDNSKFKGIEWKYLNEETKKTEPELFKAAHIQHITTNPHHPEYWPNINDMPRIFIAEMLADWYARSQEFGTDLREWIKEEALDKFNIPVNGKVHKEIKHFLDLLLEKKFS